MSNQKLPPNNLDTLAIVDAALDVVKSNRLDFDSFTHVRDMDDSSAWPVVKRFYKIHREKSDLTALLMGVILNGVLTNKKQKFLISRKLISDYFDRDPNNRRSNLNGEEHTKQVHKLLACLNGKDAFLTCFEQPSKNVNGNKQKAGLYSLSNNSIISLIPWWKIEQPTVEGYPQGLPSRATPSIVQYSTEQNSSVQYRSEQLSSDQVKFQCGDLVICMTDQLVGFKINTTYTISKVTGPLISLVENPGLVLASYFVSNDDVAF